MSNSGVYIVTGATGAIGKELTRALASAGSPVIMAVRNTHRGEEIAAELTAEIQGARVAVRELNLESPESIKQFVAKLKSDGIDVYALINNAGVMNRHYRTTSDGMESTMAVNLIGTALLSSLIASEMAPGGHIIFTTSITRKLHPTHTLGINETEKKFSQLGTYGRSKAAITHFAQWLAGEYPTLYVNCADPGIVNSNMITMSRWYDGLANVIFRPFIRTPREGAFPALKALAVSDSGKVVTAHNVHSIHYDSREMYHRHLIAEINDYIGNL